MFCELLQLIAEKVTRRNERRRPEKRANAVVEQESRDSDLKQTCKGRRDSPEAGDKLGDNERPHALPDKEILRAAHARIWLKRDAAQKAQNLATTITAQVVPDQVADEARRESPHDSQGEIHFANPCQRSGGEQHGHRGNRQSHLLGEHHGEENEPAMPDQELRHVIHR